MSQASSAEKDVKVQVRFIIEPFEIGIETSGKESETGATIASLLSAIQARQEEITTAITSMDVSKFKPIKRKPVAEAEDPLDKVALKLNVDVEELKKMFLIEEGKVFIVCKRNIFGLRGPGEKAALAMLYVYKYGLDRAPKHEEVNEAYQKVGFKPRSFGATVKGNLIRRGKILEDRENGTITLEPGAVPETETIIREILAKL